MEPAKKSIGIFCDGCYDVYHFGHANQFLQARRMGDFVVAGIHPDDVIVANKGLPVIKQEDRYKIIRSVRWVDGVMEGIGYDITPEMLDTAGCDFCVHGDDVVITEAGNDAYAAIRKQDRYRTCHRTPELSTTSLVGRLLLLTRDHHSSSPFLSPKYLEYARQLATCPKGVDPWVTVHQYDPKTKKIDELIPGRSMPVQSRVVYIDGDFDLFHIGHLSLLEEASKRGDWIVVGVHADHVVNGRKGQNLPIMSLNERVLTLLSCQYVDEMLIAAPYTITSDLLQYFHVSEVVHGCTSIVLDIDGIDPYEIPRKQGIFKIIDSKSDMSSKKIVQRILENRLQYEIRNNKLEQKEKVAQLMAMMTNGK